MSCATISWRLPLHRYCLLDIGFISYWSHVCWESKILILGVCSKRAKFPHCPQRLVAPLQGCVRCSKDKKMCNSRPDVLCFRGLTKSFHPVFNSSHLLSTSCKCGSLSEPTNRWGQNNLEIVLSAIESCWGSWGHVQIQPAGVARISSSNVLWGRGICHSDLEDFGCM